MASRRKKRKLQDVDPLGGFSMEELFGLAPVSDVEKKQGVIGKIIGLPFRIFGMLVALPFKLIKAVLMLPVRLVKAILPSKKLE